MAGNLLSLYLRARAALPLAVFLLFLGTAKETLGTLDSRTLLCGLSFWFLVQLSYVYDSLFRTREDAVNLPGTKEGVGRTWPVFAAAAVPAAYIAWLGFGPMILVAFLIIPFYSDPTLAPRRLKSIALVKSLVSVLNFWLVGILVPVLLKHELSFALALQVLRSTVLPLAFVFLLTVLLDVRDVEGDREGEVYTIPVLLGPRATAAGIGALLGAGGAYLFSVYQFSAGIFCWVVASFSFAAMKPRGRAFYEWLLAALNFLLALRLLLLR